MRESLTSENLFNSFSNFKSKVDTELLSTSKNLQNAFGNLKNQGDARFSQLNLGKRLSNASNIQGERYENLKVVKVVKNVSVGNDDLKNAPKSLEVICDKEVSGFLEQESSSSSSSGTIVTPSLATITPEALYLQTQGQLNLTQNINAINYSDILFSGEFNNKINIVAILCKRVEMPNKLKEVTSEISNRFSKFTSLINKQSNQEATPNITSSNEPIIVYDIFLLQVLDEQNHEPAAEGDDAGLQPEKQSFYKKFMEMRRNFQVAVDTQSTQSSNGVFHS